MRNFLFQKTLIAIVVALAITTSANAQVIKTFTQRSSSYTPSKLIYNIRGDFTMIGNTNLTLQSYGNYTNNSNNIMEYVDVDGDPNTFNSSSATLEFSTENGAIPECSNIIYAGLYWTGRSHDGSSSPEEFDVTKGGVTKTFNKRKISLKGPGQSTYTLFEANPGNIYYPDGVNGNMYSAYVEVTDYVRNNGIGEYFAADMAILEGNGGATGYYGGWGMIVVYENSKMNWRDVTIFDGHAYVKGNSTINYDLPVSGFHTVQSGQVNMKLGLMAGEGDVGISGDYFRIRDWQDNSWVTLSHSGNSTSNFFNSSVNTGGNPRNLNLQNNTGVDIAMFDIPNTGNSVITNNQTSTTFRYGSTQDTYIIFCIAMSVDAYIPDVEALISAEYINGVPASGTVTAEPGDTIEYTLQITNPGTEAINDLEIILPLPYTTDYLSGSLSTSVNFTPLPSPNDAHFDPLLGPTGSIVWDFGTLPLPPTGFPDSVLAEISFQFVVTQNCQILTNPDCPPQVVLSGGHTTGVGAVSGSSFDLPFIQGYETSGICIGEPISDPLVMEIDAAQFVVDSCNNVGNIRDFVFCNYEDATIPFDSVASLFPDGLRFYNTNNVTPSSIEYDDTNPFPATPGTSVYFAIPEGYSSCYYTFYLTVQDPIITYTVVSENESCIGEEDGEVDLTILGGITPITYDWTGPSSYSSTNEDITSLGEGMYYITITDSLGCQASDSAEVVTIPDNTDPSLVCPLDINVNNDLGVCGANVSYTTPVGTDNCPGATTVMLQGLASGSLFSLGTTLVEYEATDLAGNTATCSFNVTVTDNEDPVVTSCAADVTVDADPSSCAATGVSLGTPTVTDNCGIATTTNDAPSSFPVGTTTVTWTITDVNGNDVTCSQSVTVNDTQDPTITCPAPVTTTADAGVCYASGASLGSPVTNDNCGVASVTNDAPTNFNVGTTTVTWTVTDVNGNTASCTQSVTVTDDEDPIITCPSDISLKTTLGNCSVDASLVSLGNPSTSDNCGIASTVNNAPATYNVGTTTVTWTVTDVNGNTATCPQVVTVTDNEDPVVTSCAADVTVDADPSSCAATGVSLGTPTVTDNCGIATTTNDAPSSFPVGSTTVTWTITDVNGNDVTCSQSVTVNDTQDPTITCPAPVTTTADAGVCFASGVSLGSPVTNDNCGVASVTNDAPTNFNVGTTTVTWTVTDVNGNTASCTQLVTVNDNQNPTITCPGNVQVFNESGLCETTTTTISLGNPSTADNCGIASTINNAPTTFNVGTTNVVWTTTDVNGNTAQCSQTITIVDNQGPTVINCAPNVVDSVDTGICGSSTVSLGTPTATDNCGIASMTNDAPSLFPVGNTTVTWTITDVNGNSVTCTQVVTIIDDELPSITCPSTIVVDADSNLCSVSEVTLTPPTVNDNCGVASITNNAPNIYPVGTTVVTWIATDINGNRDTCYQDIVVEDNENPVFTSCPVDTSSCNPVLFYQLPSATDNCGVSNLSLISGFAPGDTFPVGTTTVIYELEDIHSNLSYCTFDVTIHPLPVVSLTDEDVSCNGFDDGGITANVSVGTAPFDYSWNNGDTTSVIDSLQPGIYDVLVTDIYGCERTASSTITEPDLLALSYAQQNISCYNLSDGSIDVTVIGGTTPYSYNWSNGANSQDITQVASGEYEVVVTDLQGCSDSLSIEITQPDSLFVTASIIDEICSGSNGLIDVTVTGGTSPFLYDWSTGSTTQDLENVPAGIYSLDVMDANGCTVSFYDTVDTYQIMDVNGILTQPLCFGDTNGIIEIEVVDGTSPFEFAWNTGDTTQTISDLVSGLYEVLITDANGCTQLVQYNLNEPDSLDLDLYSPNPLLDYNVSGFGATDGEIDLSIYGGSGNYDILWNTGDTDEDLYDLGAGFYSVTVTDINGCIAVDTITLTEPFDLAIPSGFTPNFDGFNDYFVVRGIDVFPDNKLVVFNRWGNVVYETEGYENTWDGTSNNGEALPDATYYVILTIHSPVEIELNGFVDLRRSR